MMGGGVAGLGNFQLMQTCSLYIVWTYKILIEGSDRVMYKFPLYILPGLKQNIYLFETS